MMDFIILPAVAFAITLLSISALRPLAHRLKLLDMPGGRKTHKIATPMVGGLAIFIGTLVSTAMSTRYPSLLPFMTASGILVVIGFLDDRHDIRKRVRIVAQLIAASIMVYWADIRIDNLGNLLGSGPVLLGGLAAPFTFLATLGVINAVNMMDGADGLAGGLSLVSFVFLAVIAALGGRAGEMQILCVFIFCIAAFMLHNYRVPGRQRARVFMGDAGSTFLGFAICWFSISLSQGGDAAMTPIMAVWLLAIPLLDIFAVMIRRAASGRSPLSADREHIHHLLKRRGLSTAQTVNRLIFMAILAATTATLLHRTLFLPESVFFFGFITWIGLYVFTTQRKAASPQKSESMAIKRKSSA